MSKKYVDKPPGGPSSSVAKYQDIEEDGPKTDIEEKNYLKYKDGIAFTNHNDIKQITDFYASIIDKKIVTYSDTADDINHDEEKQINLYLEEIKQNDAELKKIMRNTEYGIYINNDDDDDNDDNDHKKTNNIIRKIKGGVLDERYDSTIFTDTLYHNELSEFLDHMYIYMPNNYTYIEHYLIDNSVTNQKQIPLMLHNKILKIQQYTSAELEQKIANNDNNMRQYSNIVKYINQNNTNKIDTYIFTVKNYEGKNGVLNQKTGIDAEYSITKNIIYYKYNYNYIYGFELLFYKYYNNYKIFLDEQTNYLKSLSYIDYETIRDYTRPFTFETCFTPVKNGEPFLKSSVIKMTPWGMTHWGMIGNSFSHLIYDYLTTKNAEIEQAILNERLMGIYTASYLKEYKQHRAIFMQKIENNEPIFDNPGDYNEIYTMLPDIIWTNIIKLALLNLNKIIEKAPPVKEPIILYRGSGSNYMNNPLIQSSNQYRTTQLSSFSYNFDAAKYFYKNLKGGYLNPNAVIYKLYVHKGVRVLLTTPFVSDNLKNEAEVLIKEGQLLNFNTNIEKNAKFSDLSHDCWNSIHMTNNIHLSDDNKFRTIPFIELKPESSSVFAKFRVALKKIIK